MQRQAGGFSVLLHALGEALTPPNIVILRGPEAEVRDWQRRLARLSLPDTLTFALPDALAGLPPALNKPESAAVNAWVCRGVSCLPPIADFAEIRRILQGR